MNIVPFFHGSHPLSNWYPQDMQDEVSGITFATMEHWMMWHKAKLFSVAANQKSTLFPTHATQNNLSIMEGIAGSKDPRSAKKLGRAVQGFNEELWLEHRKDIVKKGLYLKLHYCDEALYFLLDLNPATDIICEASPYDRIWGTGFSAEDPRLQDQSQWGLNLLGECWQEILIDIKTTPIHELRLSKQLISKIAEHNQKYP